MKLLAIDRSTDAQSVALALDGEVFGRDFAGLDARSAEWTLAVRDFLAGFELGFGDIDRYVVGRGPGSFAGIRAALAFVQGLALPGGKDVAGLASAIALARDGERIAVVGDARRDRYWSVVYDGLDLARDFELSSRDALASAVPADCQVVTADGARITPLLAETFGARYLGSFVPRAERLAAIAVTRPDLPTPEPLPIYLQPAVRPN